MAPRKVIDDRYQLEQLPLARGGMGEVWVGHDTRLDREVAVKFVRFTDGVPRDELIRRFVRESRITARLRHPGVPAVYDVGTHESRPYLVMQRIHGLSISDLLSHQTRLSPAWACAIAAQVCSVLVAAHEASLVHRDLKPANVMLEPEGTVKVLDFGLAAGLDLAATSQITRTGQHIGTPAYMAPEQVMAAMSGPRTDLYALGCTLYEMLTGRKVFTGTTSFSVMSQQVDETPVSVATHRPEIAAGIDRLVLALLEKKPENRPESAALVYRNLLPWISELGPVPGIPSVPAEASPAWMYANVVRLAFTDGPDAEPAGVAALSAPAPKPALSEPITRSQLEEARAHAASLASQGRYQEAADGLVSAVDAASSQFGVDDSDVLLVRLELANVLFDAGDYRAAAPTFRQLTDDLSVRDGPDTELPLRCRHQYAVCCASLGDVDAAIEAAEALLADELRLYTARDPRPPQLRREIGMWQLAAGRHDLARRTLDASIAGLIALYGEDHPDVAKVRAVVEGIPK